MATHSVSGQDLPIIRDGGSLDLILPFIRPIQSLIEDDSVSEVMVNANHHVFVERNGLLEEIHGSVFDPHKLRMGVKNIARRLNKDFGEAAPMLDARLPNGARICAVWPSVSLGELVTLNIRKFQGWKSIAELVALGSLPEIVLAQVKIGIAERRNFLISGAVGTGKTVLLRALVTLIDPAQRIITIEDTSELSLDGSHRNVITLEEKVEQRDLDGKILSPAVSASALVKLAMRQRGDRLILGEVRGREAFDLLKALNCGSSGSFCSIHSDTAERALQKLAIYTLEANTGMPMEAIYRNIGAAVHYVLQLERRSDGKRGVAELIAVHGHNGEDFDLKPIYRR
jgi:pilus assembly protein CpaF